MYPGNWTPAQAKIAGLFRQEDSFRKCFELRIVPPGTGGKLASRDSVILLRNNKEEAQGRNIGPGKKALKT